jgi:hypothetical protein
MNFKFEIINYFTAEPDFPGPYEWPDPFPGPYEEVE